MAAPRLKPLVTVSFCPSIDSNCAFLASTDACTPRSFAPPAIVPDAEDGPDVVVAPDCSNLAKDSAPVKVCVVGGAGAAVGAVDGAADDAEDAPSRLASPPARIPALISS